MSKKDALSAEDWLKAGFRALVAEGAKGVRVEALARALKISKGSFYWHFADAAALKSAMMEFWYENATRAEIASLRSANVSGAERLRRVVGFAGEARSEFGGVGVENAIREWGRSDAAVRRMVQRMESERLAFLTECFEMEGFVGESALWRSQSLYACLIGLESLHLVGVQVSGNLERQLELLLSRLPDT
ncbi:TetR/AcrR family transcriptional regulator [Pelagibacterium lentulum]|uniref:Transcriptional regulator n=1 Tax=Pelagibacterium lentulum TaxID=2029865 RepID=A0A916VWM5_9HYPH|nr:TetR/AcrR family transcriptional regulator [Pelagibacterium lentulum]GGA45666.1 transcriptional regulator [Pelagibacterium lentulum]